MKEIFYQDEVVNPFKCSHHESGSAPLVRGSKSEGESNVSQWERTEVKVVLKQKALTSPHLLLIDGESLGPGNPPPRVSTYVIVGGSKFRPRMKILLMFRRTRVLGTSSMGQSHY